MQITLIYPGIARIGFNSLGKGNMDRNWTNLGLCYLAACLEQKGHMVDLIDLRDCLDWDDLKGRIRMSESQVFGIYFNTPNFEFAIEAARIVRENGKTVVAGGPHATILPQELLNSGLVDYVVVGEGEISFPELVEQLERASGSKERIILGKRVDNLDTLPFPDRDIFALKKMLNPRGNFPFMDNGVIMFTSRGCPYSCTFCQPTIDKLFGRKVRRRSVENVIEEIKLVINIYKVGYVSFQDDTFTLDKKWLMELCSELRRNKLSFQWSAQARVDNFDEQMAQIMKQAGCVCLFFGFESGSQKILDFYKKGITVEQSKKAADLCHRYGILIFADYILGAPGETTEDLEATLRLIEYIKPELLSPSFLTSLPGTVLYDYCRAREIIDVKNYEDFMRNPAEGKIKRVDYDLVRQFKLASLRRFRKWFQERYFACLVFKRWCSLLRQGYLKELLGEFVHTSFPA